MKQLQQYRDQMAKRMSQQQEIKNDDFSVKSEQKNLNSQNNDLRNSFNSNLPNSSSPSVPSLRNVDIPSVLVPPEKIKVERPMKAVYDFTKKSENQKFIREGKIENLECEYRSDSILVESDLKKIEAELKKQQEKRIKKEKKRLERIARGEVAPER